MIRTRNALAAGALCAAVFVAGGALAAGFFTNGVPPAGGTQYPTTIPLTGIETVPADTNLGSGLNPASEAVTTQQLASFVGGQASLWRNALIGGDFGTNLFQRGSTSASITTVLTYGPDRWWGLSGTGTAFTIIKETGAADITSGYAASARVQRTASQTGVIPVCFGQVLTSANSTQFQGKTVEFVFHALAGATFSAASGNVTATIAYGTSSDDTAANFSTGAWAGYTAATAQVLPVTTTWARYSAVAAIPVTATQVGVKICWTPVGTAGATDFVEFAGAQLDSNPGAVALTGVAGTAGQALQFERRPASVEAQLQQYYFWAIAEPAASIAIAPSGQGASTTTCILSIPLPTAMRVAPTAGFSGSLPGTATAATTLGTATWTITHVVTNTALATTYLVATAGGSTVNELNLTATVASGLTAGQTCTLTGATGGGVITASAEL